MRSKTRWLVPAALMAALAPAASAFQAAVAESKSWSNVMYLGGVAGVRGKSLDWDNKLTISKEKIAFSGKKVAFEVETSAVRRLDYTGHRHLNDGAAASGFVAAGLLGALVGSSAKSTDHYLEVTYVMADGATGGFLLRLHKDNQQQIIDAMHAATGLEK
ncbi:MAG TPA: hypothetical protein VN654_15610 [Vicinamibacterales bacterium]|nr:hypothetical protein [Vicinamibacterales bacterium]